MVAHDFTDDFVVFQGWNSILDCSIFADLLEKFAYFFERGLSEVKSELSARVLSKVILHVVRWLHRQVFVLD